MSVFSHEDLAAIAGAIIGVIQSLHPDTARMADTAATRLGKAIDLANHYYRIGAWDQGQARAFVGAAQAAEQSVLASVEAIHQEEAHQAIIAGLDVVRSIVNTVIGFALLPAL